MDIQDSSTFLFCGDRSPVAQAGIEGAEFTVECLTFASFSWVLFTW